MSQSLRSAIAMHLKSTGLVNKEPQTHRQEKMALLKHPGPALTYLAQYPEDRLRHSYSFTNWYHAEAAMENGCKSKYIGL